MRLLLVKGSVVYWDARVRFFNAGLYRLKDGINMQKKNWNERTEPLYLLVVNSKCVFALDLIVLIIYVPKECYTCLINQTLNLIN